MLELFFHSFQPFLESTPKFASAQRNLSEELQDATFITPACPPSVTEKEVTIFLFSDPFNYCRTCYEQPPLLHRKSGLLRHRRFICIGNVILGNDQVASHRRLAAHNSGCS